MDRLPAPPLPGWISTMFPRDIERYRLDVGGAEMAVTELGSGRPVLMVHGNPSWSFLYRKVMQALEGEPLRLIAPDLVGLGTSSKPGAREHTLENHAAWMASLIEQLDLSDAIVVGQDWGGPIGFLGAAAHPERFTGMVILNTVVSEPRPGFKSTAFHRFARLPVLSDLAFRLLGFPQVGMSLAQGDRSSIRGAVARAYRWPLAKVADRAAPLALARMVPDSLEHPSIAPLRRCREYVEGFDGPIEVVWGDRDPVLGKVIGWIEKLLPHAHVTRTDGGHFLQEEHPGPIAAAIRRVAAYADSASAPA
jgi:cis-3-alkyl-4-acyloxetan-2-one decarboxylase